MGGAHRDPSRLLSIGGFFAPTRGEVLLIADRARYVSITEGWTNMPGL